jgi:DNA-binding PadR family transcriptional regulator
MWERQVGSRRVGFRKNFRPEICVDIEYLVWHNRYMKSIAGNELRGHLDTMLLAMLEDGEQHGYELLRRLEERGCGLLRMREGTVYPVLYRLEDAGYVKARWEDDRAERRGPRRRMYRLTPKGKRKLAEGRDHWKQFVATIGSIVEVSS